VPASCGRGIFRSEAVEWRRAGLRRDNRPWRPPPKIRLAQEPLVTTGYRAVIPSALLLQIRDSLFNIGQFSKYKSNGPALARVQAGYRSIASGCLVRLPAALCEFDGGDGPLAVMAPDRDSQAVQFIEPDILHRARLAIGEHDRPADKLGARFFECAQDGPGTELHTWHGWLGMTGSLREGGSTWHSLSPMMVGGVAATESSCSGFMSGTRPDETHGLTCSHDPDNSSESA
jgi:hypothetical protein